MQKKFICGAFCVSILITGMIGPQSLQATEPHSPAAHTYAESVYKNGPVMKLPDAIRRAIDKSPRLQSTIAGLGAAQGAEKQSGYWSNPELTLDAENVAGDGQYSGSNLAEYTYSLKQKIEIGGKRSARKNAAQALREAANAQMLAEGLNIERDVHIAYAEVLAEAEAVKLAVEQEKLAKDVLSTVSDRVNAAAEPEIQRSKAEVAYSTSIIAREQEERELIISKQKLANLWGEINLDVSLDHAHFFELVAPAPLETYREKFEMLPDIQRLANLVAEKQSLLQLERAQAVPDPDFSVGIRDFRESEEQALMFGVSIPLPVLNRNQGNVAKATAEVVQAQSDSEQAELMLQQELAQNWQHWQASYSETERLKSKLLPAAENAFKLARAGYEKGKFPYLEVLDAQRTLFDASAQYHNALKRYHTSRANVERLTTIVEIKEPEGSK